MTAVSSVRDCFLPSDSLHCPVNAMSYSTVLLEKPTGPQTVKKVPAFFGTECSLPHWQLHAVLSQSSLCLLIQFSIILPSTPVSFKCSLSLKCPHQKPAWTPVIHTCYMSALSNYFWLAHPHYYFLKNILIYFHSCTCRCTVLCYTVLPLYTRWLSWAGGLYYFCKLPYLSIKSGQIKIIIS